MIASVHPVIWLQVMKFIKTGKLRCGRTFLIIAANAKYYDGLQRRSDTIYQIVHATIAKKETPLHVFVAQAAHEASRLKRVITILNRLGLLISYY